MKRVIGIGNALVDIMVGIYDEEMLSAFSLPRGSMQMVDAERSEKVKNGIAHLKSSVSTGGSVANTMHALGMLGSSPGYIGSVGNDNNGTFFSDELRTAGVEAIMFQRGCQTGTAVALVTPDSERTFATHLGAAVELNASEINEGLLVGYDILYVEGYLIYNYEMVEKICKLAKKAGMEVALDLSSYNVVEDNYESFHKIVTSYVDILFANEEEAKAFTGKEAEEAAGVIAEICTVAVVKTGRNGSLIRKGEELVTVGVIPVNPVDTTGAGDMYAAGFLFGYANGEPLDRCGAYGAILAGSVIEIMGAKMPVDSWPKLRVNLSEV